MIYKIKAQELPIFNVFTNAFSKLKINFYQDKKSWKKKLDKNLYLKITKITCHVRKHVNGVM